MDNRSIAVVLIVSMGIAFYWYEYRPSQIRATCEAQSTEQAQEFLRQLVGRRASKDIPEGFYIQANKEAFYVDCVRGQGLER